MLLIYNSEEFMAKLHAADSTPSCDAIYTSGEIQNVFTGMAAKD